MRHVRFHKVTSFAHIFIFIKNILKKFKMPVVFTQQWITPIYFLLFFIILWSYILFFYLF